jgi:TolB-like protein/predicted Zn-dependent protease
VIGTTLAHYRITASLGKGGMGEVWRAEDTKLGREVALKVLPEEFGSDRERIERFEREARAVASLNHPHIVTLFSVEEIDDLRFLTMELVEGRTLDQMIPGNGFEAERFFDLATPLAEAMSAAHDKSVIHRDLKPSNVMVDDDGRVKVMDFGLAKLQENDDPSISSELPTEALTGVGMVVGTVPYMSPEQIEGKIVDHRTDVFSLGVLLYEMATGVRPFIGESSPALMSSILRDAPPSVVEVRNDFPRHLGRIIGRCLEKDRRDRYQTARDVFNELRALQRESSSPLGRAGSSPARAENISAPVARPSSGPGVTVRPPSTSGGIREDEGFWVAVLPFKYTGGDADLTALAEGLSEEIVTGLSRFSYLRVIARGSTTTDARYVMEGSLRQAGRKLRIAVQLVDTESGAHLWAETYDRDFEPDELFVLQDDIIPRVVSTCADHFGVLARAISEVVRGRPVAEMTSYEALMRGFGYHFRLTPEEHAEAREALEQAVEQAPSNADCWAMLAWVYAHEFAHDFNPRPNSLDRALEAARRAVDIAASNHLAQQVLAVVLFFRKEVAGCRIAAERSMALNPMDGSNEAFFLITFLGEWERGCTLIRGAMELNPHHPGWYRAPLGVNEYRKKDYRSAVDEAVNANSPDVFWINFILAAAHGQLGELHAARKAIDALLIQKPEFARSGRQLLGKWFDPELVEHLMDGLRKAGLEAESGEVPAEAVLGSRLDDERPGIAVLPFVNRSDDPDNEYFSDGLTEELIADLAGIKALSVISLTSAMLFKGSEKDLPTIGRELGVRYVLEGSVRKAGSSLRITAQLVDAEKDTPLWSEKFGGTLEDIFEVQERVSREIVRALDVTLTTDESRRLAERPIADARAFELYLQARQEIRRFDMKALDRAAKILSQALEIEGETPPLVYLSALAKVAQAKAGVNPDPHQLEEAEAQALALLEDMPDLPQAHALLGSICYERGHLPQAVWHCNRALEGTSNDPEAFLYLGASYMAAGQPELGLDAGQRMVACDPLASISWMILGAARWFVGRAEEAVHDLERSLELDPQNFLTHWGIGYTYASLGRLEDARRHAEICVETAPENAYTVQVASLVDALEGRHEEALERLAGVDVRPLDPHNTFHISESFAMAGDTARALEVLESAVDEGFYPYPFFNEYCPFMAPLRSLPEFAPILAKAKEKTATFCESGPLQLLTNDAQKGTK